MQRKGYELPACRRQSVFGLVFVGLLTIALLAPLAARAEYHSSISFQNGAGEDAQVKLVGPSERTVAVPRDQNRTESNLPPGRYYIVVRYGDREGKFSYSKGDPFQVEEYGDRYSQISITLYKVVNGNYGSRPARKEDFDNPK